MSTSDAETDFALTVLGPVRIADLGNVYPHEHLLTDPPEQIASNDPDLVLDDPGEILLDLADFVAAGGNTIVDLTTPDYGRDVEGLANLSRQAGVHVIAATGFNRALYSEPHVRGLTIEELATRFIDEILIGVGDTDIRCGAIKVGTSLNTITPTEEVVLRAGARAHLATGCPITTHTERGTIAERQLDIFEDEGVSPTAVIVCHLDFCPDMGEVRRIAQRGAFVEFDQVPKPKYGLADEVIRRTTTLAADGLAGQLLVSGDFSRKSYFHHWTGGPGLGYLLGPFSERLRSALDAAGLGSTIVDDLFADNPQRALRFRGNRTPDTAKALGWCQ